MTGEGCDNPDAAISKTLTDASSSDAPMIRVIGTAVAPISTSMQDSTTNKDEPSTLGQQGSIKHDKCEIIQGEEAKLALGGSTLCKLEIHISAM